MELVGEVTVKAQPATASQEPLVSDWKPTRLLTARERFRKHVGPRELAYAGWFTVIGMFWLASYHWSYAESPAVNVSFFLVNAVVAALIGGLTRELRNRLSLLDNLEQAHACVEVGYEFRGGRIGTDTGVLFSSDGWLNFEGQRTRFSLKPTDAKPLKHEPHEPLNVNRLVGLHQPFQVRITDIPSDKSAAIRKAHIVCTLWWDPNARLIGVSVLPPCYPDPELVRDLTLSIKRCSVAIPACVALACGLLMLHKAHLLLSVGFFVSFMAAFMGGFMALIRLIDALMKRSKLSQPM